MRGITVEEASSADFDPDRLSSAFARLEAWGEEGVPPGAAALAARGAQIAGEAYLGLTQRAHERVLASLNLGCRTPQFRLPNTFRLPNSPAKAGPGGS